MLRKAYLLLALLFPLAQTAAQTVQFGSATYSVDEDAGTITITVSISEPPDDTVTVDYSTSGDSATEGEDYTSESGTLQWDLFDGDDKTVIVQINDDIKIEGNETFNLTLENPNGVELGDPSTTEVTIVDDEIPPPQGILQFSEAQYEFDEGDEIVKITVKRIGGSQNIVSVKCVSSDGTAKAGEDYVETYKELKWGHGDASDKFCKVIIIDDTEIENKEAFGLTLEEATGGATIGDPSTAGVFIIDNDQCLHGALQFSSATYEVKEDKESVTLTVARVDGDCGDISVSYESSDETATAWYDYIPVSGNLEWNDGDASDKSITIAIVDDTEYEGNETFNLKLKKPTGGAKIGDPKKAVVTIIDNEVPPAGTLQFSKADYSVDEDGGSVKITVTRKDGSSGAVSVEFSTADDDSAEAGKDYIGASGITLSWGDGDDSDRTFNIGIIDDNIIEGDETFILTLENATGGATIGLPNTAEVTIVDNDPSSDPGTLQFSSATYDVGEGDGTVEITVARVGGSSGEASVKAVASNGTAKKNKDFEKTTKTLKWGDGDESDETFTVPIINDSEYEDDETFSLKLKNAKGASLGNPKKAEVTIIDDDQLERGTLQFSDATYSVNEDGSSIEITVTRVDGKDGAVSVDCISSDGTATAGNDYIGIINTLSWSDQDDGDKICTVQILDDEDFEGNETFNLTLENATGGAAIGETSTAEVTIVDNEFPDPGTLQFSSATYEVGEGDGTVEITVTRVGGSSGKASVKAVAGNGTAKKNKDFEKTTKTLKWDDGDDSDKTFTVVILDDNKFEDDEIFKLKLKNAKGAELGNPKKAEVTIIDDDDKPGTLQLSYATYSVNENGGSIEITITRVGGKSGVVTVGCVSSNGTAMAGDDYIGVFNTLSWDDQDDEDKSCTVLIINDADAEGDETFYMTLVNPTGGAEIGVPGTATVTIIDDDSSQSGTLQFSEAIYNFDEDAIIAEITVSRINASNGEVSVDCISSDGSAIEGEDYIIAYETLEWGDSDLDDKTCNVDIIDDSNVEGDESFNVTLDNPTNGAKIGDPSTAVATIIDNDEGICRHVTEIPIIECKALVVFYNNTNGDGWNNNTGWNRTDKPCDWNGVTCREEHVSKLYLYSNNLNGEIPPEMADLAKLERLSLFGNKLSGAIPPELGNLSQLWYLLLNKNDLCGDIPDELMNTAIPSQGGYLKLDDNHLTTDVSNDLENWLDVRNPGWEESQIICPVSNALQFSKNTYSVNENKGTVIITVARIGSSEGEVSVDCVTSDDSATAGDDYNESFETLIWADGDSEDKECQIDILDDSDLEGNETFIVSLGYPDGAELGTLNTVMVMIIDDE
jgi:ribosomal protein L35AE/L33A